MSKKILVISSTTQLANVQKQIETGADINAKNNKGETPLHLAAQYVSNPEIINALITAEADVNAKNCYGATPIQLAAEHNENPEIMYALIAAGAEVNAVDEAGYTPLHIAAEYNKNPVVIKALIEKGAKVNAKNNFDETPLYRAAHSNSNLGVIQALIENRAEVNANNMFGETPLHMAAWLNPNPAIYDALIQNGANKDFKNNKTKTPQDLKQTCNTDETILTGIIKDYQDYKSLFKYLSFKSYQVFHLYFSMKNVTLPDALLQDIRKEIDNFWESFRRKDKVYKVSEPASKFCYFASRVQISSFVDPVNLIKTIIDLLSQRWVDDDDLWQALANVDSGNNDDTGFRIDTPYIWKNLKILVYDEASRIFQNLANLLFLQPLSDTLVLLYGSSQEASKKILAGFDLQFNSERSGTVRIKTNSKGNGYARIREYLREIAKKLENIADLLNSQCKKKNPIESWIWKISCSPDWRFGCDKKTKETSQNGKQSDSNTEDDKGNPGNYAADTNKQSSDAKSPYGDDRMCSDDLEKIRSCLNLDTAINTIEKRISCPVGKIPESLPQLLELLKAIKSIREPLEDFVQCISGTEDEKFGLLTKNIIDSDRKKGFIEQSKTQKKFKDSHRKCLYLEVYKLALISGKLTAQEYLYLAVMFCHLHAYTFCAGIYWYREYKKDNGGPVTLFDNLLHTKKNCDIWKETTCARDFKTGIAGWRPLAHHIGQSDLWKKLLEPSRKFVYMLLG